MSSLSIESVRAALQVSLSAMGQHQRADGALVNPEWGLDDPSHCGTGLFVAASVLLGEQPWPSRAERAMEYLLAYQRPSGLIDMRSCNFDSAPDTAFVVQLLASVLPRTSGNLRGQLALFLRRTFPGLMTGGFHTPNHRWVVASALAQLTNLFPELDAGPVLRAYLAEGIDIDADGCYIERSPAIYDAVTNRSLLLLAHLAGFAGARAAVHRNLEFNAHLLHADGTIETGLSRRQDYGTRRVPLALAASYLQCHQSAVARWLWEQTTAPALVDLFWLLHALSQSEDSEASLEVDGALPKPFSRHFRANGLWRVRHGLTSASVFAGTTRLLHLVHGQAELVALKISQCYFGVGNFRADSLEVNGSTALLHSSGQQYPRRPGYDLPLGQPVSVEDWERVLPRRPHKPLAPAASELRIEQQSDGFALEYRTIDGSDRVPSQIAFDFVPGGIWETADVPSRTPQAGEVLFLTHGMGRMRYGEHTIEIGPGAAAHRIPAMRDAETAPNAVRVLIPLLTPVRHRFGIRLSGE